MIDFKTSILVFPHSNKCTVNTLFYVSTMPHPSAKILSIYDNSKFFSKIICFSTEKTMTHSGTNSLPVYFTGSESAPD